MNKSQRLLDEMRHRVSNDLSLLVVALETERLRAAAPEQQAYDKAIAPLLSLAVYYRSLYAAPAHGEIDLGTHLERLVDALARSYLDRLGVRTELSLAAVRAPAGLARDLGIVVVELVTNAARHAFRGRGGRVWIDLAVDHRGQLSCRVADDGLGLDLGFVDRRISGLGLVHGLVSGFDGVLEVTPRSARGGAAFSVKLALPQRRSCRTGEGARAPSAAMAGRVRELGTARRAPIF